MSYAIAIVSVYAPKANGGGYRRPVDIRVYDPERNVGYGREGRGAKRITIAEWHNVDSRYDGQRSAYGQAMAKAVALIERLEARDLAAWAEQVHGAQPMQAVLA
jgi:hypothetical protein